MDGIFNLDRFREQLAERATAYENKLTEAAQGFDIPAMMASNPLLSDMADVTKDDPVIQQLRVAGHLLRKSGYQTLVPLLPLMLKLRGKPYHLDDHFPFEPFFRTRLASSTVVKSGRQVAKSTSLASQGLIFSNCIPYFSTLYVTPLFEQIRRFSQNYIKPFIDTSPIKALMCSSETTNSVLQRSFLNHSQMLFTFAFLDAERARGASADALKVDEVQNLDMSFLPILLECLSASKDWSVTMYTGTPLSLDGTLERLWGDSSMAEWIIRCPHAACHHENIPSLEYDLLDMIGPWSDDISEEKPGTICAKCAKPINPRIGRWVHRRPDLQWENLGLHIPQLIMPMHYANPAAWSKLLAKKRGARNTPFNVFLNEVCGESSDSGSKMVTITDLKRAAILPWDNVLEQAQARVDDYPFRVVAVDWGGGGVHRGKADIRYNSYTTIAVIGQRSDGQLHVLYGLRSLHPHEHTFEAQLIVGVMKHFLCSQLVHDYTGAGATRETIIHQAGLPLRYIIPVAYGPPSRGPLMLPKPATIKHPRSHFLCDRSRSLAFTCELIKTGFLKFFRWDHRNSEEQGLIGDFLSLIEQKGQGTSGKDPYLVIHDPARPDDFAQAVNIGCMYMCYATNKWPDLANAADLEYTAEEIRRAAPDVKTAWDDM